MSILTRVIFDPDISPPAVPLGVACSALSSSALRFSWLAASDTGGSGLAGYRIYRATASGGPYTQIAEVSTSSTVYDDSGLNPSTTYYYRVLAFDGSNNQSAQSATASATTSAGGPTWLANSPGYLPIIPGAAGHGMNTTAGSGRDSVSGGLAAAPTIYFVTNLNISGPGSLQDALEATGRRIVIPAVSGVINFTGLGDNSRRITIGSGQLIYAGQCAPSPGLHVYGAQFLINLQTAKDTVLWHLSAYQFPYVDFAIQDSSGDVVSHFHPPSIAAQTDSNIIHANCWYSAGNDEMSDMDYGCHQFTFWQTVFAEAAWNSNNTDGTPHGYGPLVSTDRTTALGSFIRCAFIHNQARNPLTRGQLISVLNCLQFDLWQRGVQLSSEPGITTQTNIEGCIFVSGPTGVPSTPIFRQDTGGNALASGSQIYIANNRALGWTDSSQSSLINSGPGTLVGSRITAAYPSGYAVTTSSDREALARLVMSTAGARPGDRASMQQRVANHLEARLTGSGNQGGPIAHPSEIGITATQNTVNHTTGSDPIPGISSQTSTPTTLGTAGRVVMGSGYTALEEWLHRRNDEVMQ